MEMVGFSTRVVLRAVVKNVQVWECIVESGHYRTNDRLHVGCDRRKN